MFTITGSRGFQLTFDNGWTISVQFGPGNYCENRYPLDRDIIAEFNRIRNSDTYNSSDAEIAAWDKDGNWYQFDCGEYTDQVDGWKNTNEVLDFMKMISEK